MAQVVAQPRSFVINAANAYVVGEGGEDAATMSLHLVSSSFSGSITIKAFSRNDKASAATPVAIPYCKLYLNGSVGDASMVSTAITDSSIILVPSSGLKIVVDCTSFTSGSMTVYPVPVQGAAA